MLRRHLPRRLVPAALVALFLALTGSTSSPAAAATSPVTADTAVRRTGYLAMADGTRLKWTVLLPAATGRFPTLMQYEGYLAGSFPHRVNGPFADRMLQEGYAILGVSMRGTACSGGVWDPFKPVYGEDGAAAVTWASQQPWSTGKLGMFSFSFAGIMQLFVAEHRPSGLAAIAPGMVISDTYRDIGFPGGILNDGFPPLWDVALHETWASAAAQAQQENDVECLANIAEHQVANEPYSLLVQGPQHQTLDAWHRERSSVSKLGAIDVPVLGVSAEQDEQVGPRGALSFERTPPELTWTISTNGYHGLYQDSRPLHAQLQRFFDHYLKGSANGWPSTPHLQLWNETTVSDPAPSFVYTSNLRPFPTRPTRLFLQPGGGLDTRAPTESGTSSYAYPTVSPEYATEGIATGSDSGTTWSRSRVVPGGYLAYSTPRLTSDLAITGPASLDVWVSSTAPDADLQATITEVRPDGQELYVERGWLRLSHRALDRTSTATNPVHVDTAESLQDMPTGSPQLVRLAVQPFTHVFRAGSRMRLWLDTPSVTGLWSFEVSPLPAVLSAPLDRQHRSALVVGVIPGAKAGAPLPQCGTVALTFCRPEPLTGAAVGPSRAGLSQPAAAGPAGAPGQAGPSVPHPPLAATGPPVGTARWASLLLVGVAVLTRLGRRLRRGQVAASDCRRSSS